MILFVRRVIIALFAVSVTNITMKVFFLAIILGFLYAQFVCQPFMIDEANSMERIFLICFVFITAILISSSISDTIIDMIASPLIVLPFALLLYYIRKVYKSKFLKQDIVFDYVQMIDDAEDIDDDVVQIIELRKVD